MIETLAVIGIAVVIDNIGYILKIRRSESFQKYHLRRIPFLWIFWAD
jgi:hypothetical protein